MSVRIDEISTLEELENITILAIPAARGMVDHVLAGDLGSVQAGLLNTVDNILEDIGKAIDTVLSSSESERNKGGE